MVLIITPASMWRMTREDQEWNHGCHSEEFWQMEVCGDFRVCFPLGKEFTKTTMQIKEIKTNFICKNYLNSS